VSKLYTLRDRHDRPYRSPEKGLLGGHARTKVYGTMDCPVALSLLRRGFVPRHRVFFADEETAIAAGYRPCGACMRHRYAEWKSDASAWRSSPRS
jgi:methylphosphotriester-DNA--protein-cysteine methyltransferase